MKKLVKLYKKVFWQNWCFDQSYHSRTEVLQIAQLLALVIFVSVSPVRENLKRIEIKFDSQNPTSRWRFSHVEKYSGFGDAIKTIVNDNFQMFRRYQSPAAFRHLQDLHIYPFLKK